MKRLKLTKEANQTMPRHPMPFAAKNMFYDERWIEKQERGWYHGDKFQSLLLYTSPTLEIDLDKTNLIQFQNSP